MCYLENKHYFCATNYIVIIRMNKHILSFYLFFCLFLFPPLVEAIAGWNSFIVNFDKSVYGKGTQTWQIAPYDDKWVYFANKNGMVQFDGNVWNVFPLNRNQRSSVENQSAAEQADCCLSAFHLLQGQQAAQEYCFALL